QARQKHPLQLRLLRENLLLPRKEQVAATSILTRPRLYRAHRVNEKTNPQRLRTGFSFLLRSRLIRACLVSGLSYVQCFDGNFADLSSPLASPFELPSNLRQYESSGFLQPPRYFPP